MTIDVSPVPLEEILPLRELYRREMDCQIVHDSLPRQGLRRPVPAPAGRPRRGLRLRRWATRASRGTWSASSTSCPPTAARRCRCSAGSSRRARPRRIEAQTNDVLLTLMLYDCASEITSDTVVFHDAMTTSLAVPGCHLPGGHRGGQGADLRAQGRARRRVARSRSTAPSSRPAGSPRTTTRPTATSSWRWTSRTADAGTAAT